MRKVLITLAIIFCLIFTTQALARSNEYYKSVVINALMNECSTKCKKTIFESEIEMAVYHLMNSVIAELQYQITTKQKERLWEKFY